MTTTTTDSPDIRVTLSARASSILASPTRKSNRQNTRKSWRERYEKDNRERKRHVHVDEFKNSETGLLLQSAVKGAQQPDVAIEVYAAYDVIKRAYVDLKKKSNQVKKTVLVTACVIAYIDIIADWVVFCSFLKKGLTNLAWMCLGSILAPAALFTLPALIGTVLSIHACSRPRMKDARSLYMKQSLQWWRLALFTALPVELGVSTSRAIRTIDKGGSPTLHMDMAWTKTVGPDRVSGPEVVVVS